MRYIASYTVCGVDEASGGYKYFNADNDELAKTTALEFVEELQRKRNERIPNRFWHFTYKLVSLSRVTQEEITNPVPI